MFHKLFGNIKLFLKFVRKYGAVTATVYALYKIFPSKFALMNMNDAGVGPPISSAISYEISTRFVMDYLPWVDMGGAKTPRSVPSSVADKSCCIWFVPYWDNVWGGGHYTLFRFANHFAKHGTRQIIFVYNGDDNYRKPEIYQAMLDGALKDCKLEVVVDPKLLPACEGAFATTWQSAYHVRAFPFARKKFYFMQDYESQFYAHGSASMQANNTYSFGFIGICGGTWLKSRYESYGTPALNYIFAADKDIFYPPTPNGKIRSEVKRLFFYGRPSTPRRCFELGMVALKKISEKYPDVEILIAGLSLKSPPPFKATLLGSLTLKETGDLYRTCDVGLAFSGTNLSYIPVELMASGCVVLSNKGPQVEWLCRHNENTYLTDPAPQAVLEAFDELYANAELRQKLVDGGLKTMSTLSWENEIEKIYNYVSENLEDQALPPLKANQA